MRTALDSALADRHFIDRPPRLFRHTAATARDDGDAPPAATPDVSVVVPFLNEEESVAPLYAEIRDAMDASGLTWELIAVDDGSTDAGVRRLRAAAAGDPRLTIVEFSRRFGQTSALAAGFRWARGRCVVPLDADLQNDPRDIPRLVAKLDEDGGYDVVSGWRRNRQDALLSRRFPSVIANRLIARLTWTPIHDFGCTLKAYRREVLDGLELYGEMHRFLPALCRWRGARICEVVVNHRPRAFGRSKYNLRRTFKVLLDLVTVKFLGDYAAKPIYFFGKLSLVILAASFVALGVAFAQKFGYLIPGGQPLNLNRNVLVLLAMMLFLMGGMTIMLGVISELLVRIYYESQGKTPYIVRRVWRPPGPGPGWNAPTALGARGLSTADDD